MGRPKTPVRVSLKGKDGESARINILPLVNGRFAIYRDGKSRGTVSATEFGKKMAQWLRAQS